MCSCGAVDSVMIVVDWDVEHTRLDRREGNKKKVKYMEVKERNGGGGAWEGGRGKPPLQLDAAGR